MYKECFLAGSEGCVNAGAMLWERAERWVFGQSSMYDDAMRHACGFEFPSELALARLGLDLQVVGVLLFTCETIITFVGTLQSTAWRAKRHKTR